MLVLSSSACSRQCSGDYRRDETGRARKAWDRSAGADLLRSWFAGFLRSREIAEIDSIIQSEQGRGSRRASSPRRGSTERPMGPLQVVWPCGTPHNPLYVCSWQVLHAVQD